MPTETPIPTVTPIPSVTFTPAPQPTPIVGRVVQPDVAGSIADSGLRLENTPLPTQGNQISQRNEVDVEALDSANDEDTDSATVLNPDNIGQTSTISELPATIEPSNTPQLFATATALPNVGAAEQGVDNSVGEDAQVLGAATVMDRLRGSLLTGVAYGALIGLVVLLILVIRGLLARRRH